MENILTDPSKLTVIALLGAIVLAFLADRVYTKTNVDRQITALNEAHGKHVESLVKELDRALNEAAQFRTVVLQQIDTTNKALGHAEATRTELQAIIAELKPKPRDRQRGT